MTRKATDYAAFRRRLREARLKAGMTQTEAARRLGKPQSHISKVESGERRVDAVELRAYARLYGVRITFFYDW